MPQRRGEELFKRAASTNRAMRSSIAITKKVEDGRLHCLKGRAVDEDLDEDQREDAGPCQSEHPFFEEGRLLRPPHTMLHG